MTRSILTLFSVFCVFTFIPTAVQAEEFSAAQKEELNKLFEEYLLNNGELVLKSVNQYQAKIEEKDQAEASEKAKEFLSGLKGEKDLPMGGNPDGDITIVEFFDYNCGYCHKALEDIKVVLKDDKEVKIIFMDMPILGPSSVEAAKWSLAAHEQGKYFDYHLAIMEHNGQKNEKVLEDLAKGVGLDIKKMKKDKDSAEIAKTIQDNIEQAQLMGIRGTPGFIIGDQISPGYVPAAQMKLFIKQVREK